MYVPDINGTTELPDVDRSLNDTDGAILATIDFWMNGVVTNIIVILGLIGNILTILILSQRAMRSSTNYYLSALATWDTIVLISTAFLIGLFAVPDLQYYKYHIHAYVVSYLYPIAVIAQTATIWLTVGFTVERYIAVCHPLKAASMCTIYRAKLVILGVSIGSVLYNLPRWFDYKPVLMWNSERNETIVVVAQTTFNQNRIYRQVFFSGLYVPIMCIVPLIVLSLLNAYLIRAVRKSQRQRKTMNVRQSRENNVTIMLVTIVIVFIICQVPALIYNIAYAIDGDHVETNFSYQVLSCVRNFLATFNSAVNFILYCALGQKFRTIFLHTFCWRCFPKSDYQAMSGVHNTAVTANNGKNCTNLNHSRRSFDRRLNDGTFKLRLKPSLRSNSDSSQDSGSTSPRQTTFILPSKATKAKRNDFHRSSEFMENAIKGHADTEIDEEEGVKHTLLKSENMENGCGSVGGDHSAKLISPTNSSPPPLWLNGKPMAL